MESKKDILFNDFLKNWLEEIKAFHARSTYVKYCQMSKNHILPFFQGKQLREITKIDLIEFQIALKSGELKKSNKTYSDATIRFGIMIVNQVMKLAFKQGKIPTLLSAPPGSKKPKIIVQVFSSSDQTKLETYIKTNRSSTTLGIYLCLYTGIRLGEICALKWGDVNCEEGYLHIRQTVQRLPIERADGEKRTELVITLPKSSSSVRLVPIPSFILPMLRSQRKDASSVDFVLTGSKLLPMDPRTFQYRYKRCLKNAGIPYLNFHALRHTFATRCITVGIDPKTLSEILGHSDIKITMDYYFHSSFEFKKNQIERLTAFI